MKKRIQTINKRVPVTCNESELEYNEALVISNDDRVTIKAFQNGVLNTISDGNYQEKTVTGVQQVVEPDGSYNALTKVTINYPNKFTRLVTEANKFYQVTGGASGGTVTIQDITDTDYIVVCVLDVNNNRVYIAAVNSSGEVETVHAANETAYIAFATTKNPSGTESGTASKNPSTKSAFEEKIVSFL